MNFFRKNKKIKIIYAILTIFLFLAQNVRAGLFGDGPSVSVQDVLGQVEDRYGYDQNIWRRAKKKNEYPTVEIFFDNTSPEEGDMVTASAVPYYFKNAPENLYYTWYIVHKEEFDSGKINIEDAKREAMGIVARGSFDPILFNRRYEDGGKDPDEDGFDAPVGGSDGVGAKADDEYKCTPNTGTVPEGSEPNEDVCFEDDCYIDSEKQVVNSACISRCYEHNFGLQFGAQNGPGDAGRDKVVNCEHHFVKAKKRDIYLSYEYEPKKYRCESNDEVGHSNTFTTNDELCWLTDPENADTDGDGIEDEADLAGLAQDTFTWQYKKGDKIGVLVEGTSQVAINEGDQQTEADNTSRRDEDAEFNFNLGTTKVKDILNPFDDYDSSSDEDHFESQTNYLNPYYKITWAGLEVCNKHNKDFVDGDGCDDADDYGYHFYALKEVNEDEDNLIETELEHKPINPQFDTDQEEYSDTITINAIIRNEVLNSNFVYFEWDIYRCNNGDIDNCPGSGDSDSFLHLTEGCEHGDLLEECTKKCVDKNNNFVNCSSPEKVDEIKILDSDSYVQGMGVNEINFKPKAILIDEDKQYFNIFLKARRYQGDTKYSLSRTSIPITKNDLKIKLYKLHKDENSGKYTFDDDDEICKQGLYKTMCPVYPFQVLAAKAEFGEGSPGNVSYNWKLGENIINSPLDCEMSFEKGCDLGNIAYFPITGEDLSVNTIGVIAKRKPATGEDGTSLEGENGEDLISERLYSINPPSAVIKTQDTGAAWQSELYDESKSDMYFETSTGNKVTFKASMIPDYLKLNEDVYLDWYLNGVKVTEDFINETPGLEVEINEDGDEITYKVLGKIGNNSTLGAKIKKNFSFDELRLLQKNWNILNVDPIESDSIAVIKKVYNPASEEKSDLVNNVDSLRSFFASTIKNTPDYLVFILRISILLMIIWGVIFGIDYLIQPYELGGYKKIKDISKK